MIAYKLPLCVDLDGTLIFGDLLVESARKMLLNNPIGFLATLRWLLQGKASFKSHLADLVHIDPQSLPYNKTVLSWILEQKSLGRPLVLCTGSDQKYANSVQAHLQCFDEILASDGVYNLVGANKASALCGRFGEKGFDYIGNSFKDLPVWRYARLASLVSDDNKLELAVKKVAKIEMVFRANLQ